MYCFDVVLPKYTEKELEEIKTGIHLPSIEELGPYGTQNINDIQENDEIESITMNRGEQFKKLCSIVLPTQGTHEWFAMRNNKITASDIGTILDMNKNEAQYNAIIKKVFKPKFESNKYCHHGKKYEHIALSIYKYRMNVSVQDFGLIEHPQYEFIGASPDGICTEYKHDGIHLSKYVGRMIEIKCPLVREIKTCGDDICPPHYWAQIQIQLECCELDECDFWQCKIMEYPTKEKFIEDTNPEFKYKSLTTGFEKGCIIQLMPKHLTDFDEMAIYDNAKYVYPPKIEMTPEECDEWINSYVYTDDYIVDKIIYWKLCKSSCITINRDKNWFNENLPKLKKMWEQIVILRNNKSKSEKLQDFINSMTRKNNKQIMNFIESICSE